MIRIDAKSSILHARKEADDSTDLRLAFTLVHVKVRERFFLAFMSTQAF
eukprot:COSAG06_NODE_578_length_14043_cov_3.556153_9_plen_49_part_00